MPVLKAQTFNPARKDAVVLDLGDLGRQAGRLKALAEQKASVILDAAQQEAARLTAGAEEVGRAQGHAEGFAQGLEEGRAQGKAEAVAAQREQIDALRDQWSTALSDFESHRASLEREARSAVLRLAVCLAEKVVHRAVSANPDAVVDQVRAALRLVMEPTQATLRVHPEDRAQVAEVLPELVAEFDLVEHAEAIADPGVARGGCVLTYGPGRIDATIETQLARLSELLLAGESAVPHQAEAAGDVEHSAGTGGALPDGVGHGVGDYAHDSEDDPGVAPGSQEWG